MGLHPPPGVPIYGLVDDVPAPRWAMHYQGSGGEPLWAVDLAHGDLEPGTPWTVVETIVRSRFTTRMVFAGRRDIDDLARYAVNQLLEFGRPDIGGSRRGRLAAALHEVASEAAAEHDRWPVVDWTVDGKSVAARTFSFAGHWLGLCVNLPGVFLAAYGTTTSAEGLRLAATDGREYAVDFTRELNFAQDLQRSRAAAQMEDWDTPRPLHPDHERLLARSDASSDNLLR